MSEIPNTRDELYAIKELMDRSNRLSVAEFRRVLRKARRMGL